MKHWFLILIIISSLPLFSQGFKAGISAGFVASQVDGDESSGYNKLGFQGGAYTRYLFNDKWSILSEMKFIQKGSKESNEESMVYFSVRLNYVEVPLLLQYTLKEKFHIGAGLSIANLIGATVEDANGKVSQNYLEYTTFDYNLLLNISFQFYKHWIISNRFAYSVFPITKSSPRQFNNLIGLELKYEL
ncbi:MAG: PorT family protein [Bacteroidales bacterium]|nr:PorT family protein [Bacteroidales bacterium]